MVLGIVFLLGMTLGGDPAPPTVLPAARPIYPPHLPVFDVRARIDPGKRLVEVSETIVWTHPGGPAVERVVIQAHAAFVLPPSEEGGMAKTLEMLRLDPRDALGVKRPALQFQTVALVDGDRTVEQAARLGGPTGTDLDVSLPAPVGPGGKVTIRLVFQVRLDEKQGRWGLWNGVVNLMQWLPVPAFYGAETGWQPSPFLPWHQPFLNEAGHYRAAIEIPDGWELASSGAKVAEAPAGSGWREITIEAWGVRDFSLAASAKYIVATTKAPVAGRDPVVVRVLALEHHKQHAEKIAALAADAITTYSSWMGAYPWPELTIAETYFGWNGNEGGSIIMIDERVFTLPALADGFIEYLIIHETCHQWWYNAVGTDGYREPFMDEGLATALSHRLLDKRRGKNHAMLSYPTGLDWLPNIARDSYRNRGWSGLAHAGFDSPVQRGMQEHGNLALLFGTAYDKSSKVFDILAERMGESAFLEFLRSVQRDYRYRILRAADFERELAKFTGQDWTGFFDRWWRGPGQCDWALDRVETIDGKGPRSLAWSRRRQEQTRIRVVVSRTGPTDEATSLGIRLPGQMGYPIRIPVATGLEWRGDNPPAEVTPLPDGRVQVMITLPVEPESVMVDPDMVLPDPRLHNNHTDVAPNFRPTFLYTTADENDLTTANDRWNVIVGPWLYGATYSNPWYTRTTMLGARAGAYRSQEFQGGIYGAYRTDYRDVVIGFDGTFEHWPDSAWQTGFNAEQRVYEFEAGQSSPVRATLFTRNITFANTSIYQLPFDFTELYTTYSGNFLPYSDQLPQGAVRYSNTTTAGWHIRRNRQTPYWDPSMGWQFDAVLEGGGADLDVYSGMFRAWAQGVLVKHLPDVSEILPEGRVRDAVRPLALALAETKVAMRAYGGTALPGRGAFFPLGGGESFRGFDLAQRQGSTVWVGSVEWRIPLIRHMETDFFDHVAGLRTIQMALFYDVGDALAAGHSAGPVAHALGAGVRFDAVLLSFVERATFRFDFAQTLGQGIGPQFWFGINQPF